MPTPNRSRPGIAQIVLAVALLTVASPPSTQGAAPPQVDPRIEKRDKVLGEANTLLRAGDWDGGTRALLRAIALEREARTTPHEDLAKLLNAVARLQESRGAFDEARGALTEVAKVSELLWGARDWRTADARQALKDLVRRQRMSPAERAAWERGERLRTSIPQLDRSNKTKEVLQAAREVVAIRRRILEPPHPGLANSLNNLGVLLASQGLASQAETSYREALALYRQIFPKASYPNGHPSLASCVNNLASLMANREKLGHAEAFYREAVGMCATLYPKEHYPSGHPDLAHGLNNLGTLQHRLGDHSAAETLIGQAVAMYRRLHPSSSNPGGHPNLASSLTNLGAVLADLADYPAAEERLQEALEMYRKLTPRSTYPSGHPSLARCLNCLGGVLLQRGAMQQAEKMYREALDLLKKRYPGDSFPNGHVDLATTLNNVGHFYQASGNYPRAADYHRRSVAMSRKLYALDRYPNGSPLLATCLHNLGSALREIGDYAGSGSLLHEALAMRYKLYPRSRFPDGHPEIANGLNSLAILHASEGNATQAEEAYRSALDIYRRIYPKHRYPNGHASLASILHSLASLQRVRGNYAQSESLYREAMDMRANLFPKRRFPNGHPDLANSMQGLGNMLLDRGELAQAEQHCRETLTMLRRLYPKSRHPEGHPLLANALTNLGAVRRDQGNPAAAAKAFREALEMYQHLFPPSHFPDGHPDLSTCLSNLAAACRDQRDHSRAEELFQRSLALRRKLFPKTRFPTGHPVLVTSLTGLATVHHQRERFAEAERMYREALAVSRQLYPRTLYPDGHPNLAAALTNLGRLLQDRRMYPEAAEVLTEALSMGQRLAWVFAATESQAEALNFLARLPRPRDLLIDLSASGPAGVADPYPLLWQGKFAISRVVGLRAAAMRSAPDPLQGKASELRQVRSRIAHFLLAGSEDYGAARDQFLSNLNADKERLEKELGRALPALESSPLSPSELLRVLPPRSAFVDFYRYLPVKNGKWQGARYAAWVLADGRSPRRVELGLAASLEADIGQWRSAIAADRDSPAAARLRQRVWERLELPVGVTTVWISPDGALGLLPWSALPGRRPGSTLLEVCSVAVVPQGTLLFQQLTAQRATRDPGPLLVVGGVDYGSPSGVSSARGMGRRWSALPGAEREARQVAGLASRLPRPIARLHSHEKPGSTTAVLAGLGKARWAHLATHGFFASPGSTVRQNLYEEGDFQRGAGRDRVGAVARNPLLAVGVVLAGANNTSRVSGDSGILTGEAIAACDLSRMRLAVLSACDTGLGETDSDAGVFGLQQAFHLAGCRNVVASLWKVDDDATAALMGLFYHQMWVRGLPPLEALRQAQLGMYRRPELVTALRKMRDSDWVEENLPVPSPGARFGAKASTRLWASFVLSGIGD